MTRLESNKQLHSLCESITEVMIGEARKNADVNIKVSINAHIADHLKKFKDSSFVAFSKGTRVGVNTSVDKHTKKLPIGVFAYPSSFVMKHCGTSDIRDYLPIRDDAEQPYANLFVATGNVVDLTTLSASDLSKYGGALVGAAHRIAKSVNPRELEAVASKNMTGKTPGHRLWKLSRGLAEFVATATGRTSSFNILWNTLFRTAGIDGVYDTGKRIIRPAAISHAIFFSTAPIGRIQSEPNAYNEKTAKHNRDYIGPQLKAKAQAEPKILELTRQIEANSNKPLAADAFLQLIAMGDAVLPKFKEAVFKHVSKSDYTRMILKAKNKNDLLGYIRDGVDSLSAKEKADLINAVGLQSLRGNAGVLIFKVDAPVASLALVGNAKYFLASKDGRMDLRKMMMTLSTREKAHVLNKAIQSRKATAASVRTFLDWLLATGTAFFGKDQHELIQELID